MKSQLHYIPALKVISQRCFLFVEYYAFLGVFCGVSESALFGVEDIVAQIEGSFLRQNWIYWLVKVSESVPFYMILLSLGNTNPTPIKSGFSTNDSQTVKFS